MKLLFILMFIVSCADTGQRIDTENTIELFDTTTEITIKDLKNHIGFLASDELEGRASGTLGDEMAKDYIQKFFKNASLPTKRLVEIQEHYVPAERKWNLKPEDMTVKTYNIIATIPGNDPILKDEYVIIGGHYDGGAATAAQLRKMTGEDKIYNNADDNASGTATVLELFEKYASENSNKRSLVFILFGGEELGLLGSKHYVENPTIDLNKVQLMINLDMMGRLNEELLYVGGVTSGEGFKEQLQIHFDKTDMNIDAYSNTPHAEDRRYNRLFQRSDHYNFYKKDIPCIFFFTGIHDDYHQPSDEIDKLNFDGIHKIANLVDSIVIDFSSNNRLKFQEIRE